jgi:hypothetical protein
MHPKSESREDTRRAGCPRVSCNAEPAHSSDGCHTNGQLLTKDEVRRVASIAPGNGFPHEARHCHHQAVQARRGPRRSHQTWRSGVDRHRGTGLRASKGPHRKSIAARNTLSASYRRSRSRSPAYPIKWTRSSRQSSRPRKAERSATARSLCTAWTMRYVFAPAKPTPTRSERRFRPAPRYQWSPYDPCARRVYRNRR